MPTRVPRHVGLIVLALFLVGLLLRAARLNWQPLWWDEGYSVYFATEPVARMFWLTAHDIHPPLYYLLLHGWFALLDSTGPVAARLLSVGIGATALPIMVWSMHRLLPARPAAALIAAAILAISPMHLYYSHEVRMYGLALLWLLVASTAFWQMVAAVDQDRRPWRWALLYVAAAALALWTLYYSALWLVAHQLWVLLRPRRSRLSILWAWGTVAAILLLQLPWWLYALPQLIPYVADKVVADQDQPLALGVYLWRHWLAWTTGHLTPVVPALAPVRQGIAALLLAGTGVALWRARRLRAEIGWLLTLILIPLLLGFLVNLRLPFFPEGGERLQLAALPYLIMLLVVLGQEVLARRRWYGLASLLVLLPALGGIITFYTLPRYVEHDYRPIVQVVAQHSREEDSVLALFPWQVGYWRAYSPRLASGAYLSPQPQPLDQAALVWSDTLAQQLDQAAARGTVWFPEPLSFGSTLPGEIESYLIPRTYNVENRWFSPATRLSAWAALEPPATPLTPADFGEIALAAGSVGPDPVVSGNVPLALQLAWRGLDTNSADWRATIRLQDDTGYTWAQRDLARLGLYAHDPGASPLQEQVALLIPTGLPPGDYTLAIGVGRAGPDADLTGATFVDFPDDAVIKPVAAVAVAAPAAPLAPARLPVEHPLPTPQTRSGITFLGYSGPAPASHLLAGDQLALRLMAQGATYPTPARDLFVSLVADSGEGLAGWEGWPLPSFPTPAWQAGQLAQLPIQIDLPATLPPGPYRLIAGVIDPATGMKSAPVTLAGFTVVGRPHLFTAPPSAHLLTRPVQFGTHVELIGYEMTKEPDAGTVITLTWQVIQPLLPPHHIFVHAVDAEDRVVAQADGAPMTAAGRAPTGSWLPGEYLQTRHRLPAAQQPRVITALQVGLYAPTTEVRLPAARGGTVYGDSAMLPFRP